MVNYDLLSLLPRGAVFVNTARGEIVDLDGVERCLKEGIISGAGLDVLPQEPIPEPAHSLIQAYRNKEEWLVGSKFSCRVRAMLYSTDISSRDGDHLPHGLLQPGQLCRHQGEVGADYQGCADRQARQQCDYSRNGMIEVLFKGSIHHKLGRISRHELRFPFCRE